MAKTWFRAKANGESSAEIAIYNDIGAWGVSAQSFYDALKGVGPVDNLDILISSDGGDVTTGFAIYDMLARHSAYKVARVQGLAASMASVIPMAADEIVMPSNSFMMIHNPWGGVVGESEQIKSFAEVLDMMRDNIRGAYQQRTGLDTAKIAKMMDAETWLTADEAVKLGFADRVDNPMEVAARFDVAKFTKVPKSFGAHSKEKTMTTKTNDAANGGGDNGGDSATKTREEIVAEAKEIRSLCKLAGKAELADKFIEDGKTVSDVIGELAKLRDADTAKGESESTNAHHTTTNGRQSQAKTVDPVDIFDRFNKASGKR
ncbi:head maturation protease, ClpP-related [Bradyrhizobium sp. 153]|uniref:head maturation protease, ClpP-related n=1 Tax=Bradyrhizobium sp. 153 TaxID=2782627 RepID=UPI001FF8F4B5|nr:head maturation protease, ClpP-related [Bradyrhizobium sp. 153]MCK1668629.1 Clp protease ClpP [Bradyrhizobium sp. 153]